MFTRALDFIFTRLATNADLVFFSDSIIMSSRFETWSTRQNTKYERNLKIIDQIGIPLMQIAANIQIRMHEKIIILGLFMKSFSRNVLPINQYSLAFNPLASIKVWAEIQKLPSGNNI